MERKYKLAKNIKPGDVVILDMGYYGGRSNDTPCKIVRINHYNNIWDKTKTDLSFGYRADNGGVDDTCSFEPNQKMTLVRYRKPRK